MNDPHLTQLEQSLKAEVSTLRDGLAAQDQFIAEQNAGLRRLVAWLRDERKDGVPYGVVDAPEAFDFTAGLIEEILSNSTVVMTEVDPKTGLDL